MPRVQHTPLTDQKIRHLKPGPRPVDVRDGLQRGLIVTVLPSGRTQFAVRYRTHGKQRRLVLGDFPALSLSKAREQAQDARNETRRGRDLVVERAAAKAPHCDTVAALAEEYMKRHARKFKRSADEDERMLNVDVLPHWKDRSVRELTRRDVRELLDIVVNRKRPIMANHVLALVRKMLNFAVDHDWIEANPAARVAKPGREVSRDRILTDEELKAFWRVLSRFPTTQERPAPGRKRATGDKDDPLCPISKALAALLKVRLLTAQRGGEVARMRWADLTLEAPAWWTIPRHDTKNGEPHRVPLCDEAVALIRAQIPERESDRGEYVFLGRGGTTVVDRAKKAPAAIRLVLPFDFRGHDLRRTAATFMAAAGVPREHIARVLNHVEGGARATRVYDRHTYDREKRLALETWEHRLKKIVEQGERKTSNVTEFSKSA